MRHLYRLVAAVTALLALVPAAKAAHAADRYGAGDFFAKPAETNAVPDIQADNFSFDRKTGWYTVTGNVRIVYGDNDLHAQMVRIRPDTGEIEADGNVTLIRKDQNTWNGEHIAYNYMTGAGLASDLDLRDKLFRVVAGESERGNDGTFYLDDVKMTTCTNEPGFFHYHVHGGETEFKPNGYLKARDAVLYLGSLPIFYVPYWYRDFEHHYGFRFVPGYSSRWGAYLLSAYVFRMVDFGQDEEGRDMEINSKTHVDVRSKRGVAFGEDISWYLGGAGRGWISGYFLDDKDPRKRDVSPYDELDPSRYRFNAIHDVAISAYDRIRLQGTYVSDNDVLKDFFEDDYRINPQPENYLTYSHNADYYTFGIGAYARLNDFYDGVNRLPEAWFETYQTEIAETGIYYEGETRGGWIQREFADFSDVSPEYAGAESYDTTRFDTYHMFSYPKKFLGFLQVVPRAGFRATYYGDTYRGEESIQPAYTTFATNELGQTVATLHPEETITTRLPDGSGVRFYPEFGVEVSFAAYGMYEDLDGNPWRHIVEPYANYTFIPEPSLVPSELPQFDGTDKYDLTHNIRIGTRHKLQTKNLEGHISTPLDVDVFGIIAIDGPGEDPYTGLQTIGVDGKIRPAKWFNVDFDGYFDADASEISSADARLWLFDNPLWHAYGEVNYRVDKSTLYTGGIVVSFTDAWSVNAYSRYEAEDAQLEEVGGYVQFQTDCLIFRLKGRFIPSYIRSNGVEEEDDYKVSLNTWLRAFPPDDIEDPTPWY